MLEAVRIFQSYLESLFRLELSFSNKLAAFDASQINLLYFTSKVSGCFLFDMANNCYLPLNLKHSSIFFKPITRLEYWNIEWWWRLKYSNVIEELQSKYFVLIELLVAVLTRDWQSLLIDFFSGLIFAL